MLGRDQMSPSGTPGPSGLLGGSGRLRIVVAFPDLLGTYGDRGNGLVLAQRARWRGVQAELLEASAGNPIPEGDIYCLGGGEDGPQAQAAEALRTDSTFLRAVDRGAVVLAVCAGFQIVGHTFPDPDGRQLPGLGLLDIETFKHTRNRMVGEVVADPLPPPEGPAVLPQLTGFENHGGATQLGSGVHPLSSVAVGVGNGWGDGSEGAWRGRVLGTYMHGPFLARNPAVADLLLGWAVGDDHKLEPIQDSEEETLREQRFAATSLSHGAVRRYWSTLTGRT